MSYILDALRKADVQRQRSRLPGLHAQATSTSTSGASPGWPRSPVMWAVGAGLLVLASVVAWTTLRPQPAAVAQAPVAVVVPPPATPPAPPAAAAPVAAAPAVANAIEPAPPRPRPEPAPRVATARPTAQERAPAAARPASAAAPAASAAAAVAHVPATASAAAESAVPPPGAPKLVITGGVYSPSPAQRMLIVGGQVFNEGSEVAPGVVLEQVRPNQALLRFQGQRYTQRY
ncbi:MAG: general secretion pathway protein GspB [Ramlibacter sp.]